jgi:hypothetical protein
VAVLLDHALDAAHGRDRRRRCSTWAGSRASRAPSRRSPRRRLNIYPYRVYVNERPVSFSRSSARRPISFELQGRVGVSSAEKESGLRTRRAPTPSFGYVATGPGTHVWEETRAQALRTARDLSRGAPVSAVPAGSRASRVPASRR